MKKTILTIILFFTLTLSTASSVQATDYGCGDHLGNSTVPDGASCNCAGAQWEGYNNGTVLLFIPITNRDVCCGWVKDNSYWSGNSDQCLSANPTAASAFCGDTYSGTSKECICGGGGGMADMGGGKTCCGWLLNGSCSSTDTGVNDVEVSGEMLNSLNPLASAGGDTSLSTPGAIISKALGSFVFPIAGIILFVVLLLGGFQMLTGATNSKSLDEGKQRITAAIMGFLLLFAAYWIAQLLELIFGIRILS